MDHPLTPSKIKRLINIAEDRCSSFQRLTLEERNKISRLVPEYAHQIASKHYQDCPRNTTAGDCSSGLLDLERVEAFGESVNENVSMCKSTVFNPGEMTGRSTGTDDAHVKMPSYGRHSMAALNIENIEKRCNTQSNAIMETMRYSICTDATFHSNRDLTADEASFANKGGALQYNTVTQFTDTNNRTNDTSGNMSVGAYFRIRSEQMNKMLPNTDSPNRSMAPSITEVSGCIPTTPIACQKSYSADPTLDNIPVRQPRLTDVPPKNTNMNKPKVPEKQLKPCNLDNVIVNDVGRYAGVSQYMSKTLYNTNASSRPCRILNTTSRANDLLKKTFQPSLRLMANDESGALDAENSISISKIADYLGGKQSDISVTDFLNNHKGNPTKKQPLTEVQMNIPASNDHSNDTHVIYLKDTKKTETASTTNTMNTVISMDKLNINDPRQIGGRPEIIITKDTIAFESGETKKRLTKSHSPKSQSTLSTVQENRLSFKSGDSPFQSSRGDGSPLKMNSQIDYKELDKSVDWHDVMRHKHLRQSFGKENWVEIITTPHRGFVGVSCPVTISVTTLTDSWLTATFRFDDLPNNGADLSIELPRFPILLSPGNTEEITINITSSVEMNTAFPFTLSLKDVSIDSDIEQKGNLQINFEMPTIQAVSSDGMNKITFPETFESTSLVKSFVLFSDCLADLRLAISIADGDNVFAIKNITEIKKGDINKVLMDRQGSVEDQQGKAKNKPMSKQLCKLSSGNAIRVSLKFNAPKLGDLKDSRRSTTFTGTLHVNLIGVNTLLNKVGISGIVGYAHLDFILTVNKLQLGKIPTTLTLSNIGNMQGTWAMRYGCTPPSQVFPFKVVPTNFELQPGSSVDVSLTYTGPEDVVTESKISFEEKKSGKCTTIEIVGGTERPKTFPIKTNRSALSWIRSGRKELSLKNSIAKKVQIRCSIVGEGFSLDMPGIDSARGGAYCLNFAPLERRTLPIIFSPSTSLPYSATLHVVIDKNSEFTRKVRLYGCASTDPVRWFSQVTYGDTALVRAASRMPIKLELFNKSTSPAFVCAKVHFNLQFTYLEGTATLMGDRRVVPGRGKHPIVLNVDWARVEMRAREGPVTSLATITVLTGQEFTRRRILKVLKDKSGPRGEIDISLLPEHLAVLADSLLGEDPQIDIKIADFDETEAALPELLGGLQELSAQIDLPQDFAEDNTIIISDDTVVEHHTLYE